MIKKLLFAVLAVLCLGFLAGPVLSPVNAQFADPKKEKQDSWPKVFNAPANVDMGKGRTMRIVTGSVKVFCENGDNKTPTRCEVRSNSMVVFGPPGTDADWSDVTIQSGHRCDITIHGHGAHMESLGDGTKWTVVSATTGGSMKTGPGAEGNTGGLGPGGVTYHFDGGDNNCFSTSDGGGGYN